jgi:hypothetical protein
MSEKHPLVLWSGGLDSTWMLWEAVQKGDVDYVTVNGGQCRNKRVSEEHARSRALKWMRARTSNTIREIKCHVELRLAEMPALTWSQTVPWLVGALSVVDHKRHSSLEIGYVMGDEVACILDVLKTTWEGLQLVSKHEVVPLNFPLTMISKRRILENIPRGLYDCIWYCELPQLHDDPRVLMRVPCDRCAACITHKTELYRFELHHQLGRELGRYDPEVLPRYGSEFHTRKPKSTLETVYAYLPVRTAHHMGMEPDQPYTLLANQVVYTQFDKVDYLYQQQHVDIYENHTLGLQIPQPFDRYLEEISPGVFNLKHPIPSELIFTVYNNHGECKAPKDPIIDEEPYDGPPRKEQEDVAPNCDSARRLLASTLNDSPIVEETSNARLSLHEPSAEQECQEVESTAQSA